MKEPLTETTLRDYLRDLKEQSGMSFEQIAQAIGEDARNVKRWLAENPVEPRGISLLKYLDATGVTLSPPAPRAGAVNEEIRKLRDALEEQDPETMSRIDRALVDLADQVAELRTAIRNGGA